MMNAASGPVLQSTTSKTSKTSNSTNSARTDSNSMTAVQGASIRFALNLIFNFEAGSRV